MRVLKMVIVSVFAWGFATSVAGDEPLAEVRKYPPNMIKLSDEIPILEWHIEQLKPQIERYARRRDEISEKMTQLQIEIDHLNKKIPPEFRNIDKQVRSQLIGKALEKLLDAKLELTALQQTLEMHEKEKEKLGGKVAALRQQEMQIETAVAKKRYELAKIESEKMSHLKNTGTLSVQQAQRAKYSAEIAMLEYENAKAREAIELERGRAEAANELAEARLSAVPVKAKIKTIEEFLERISESSATINLVEHRNREIELWRRDLEMVASELFELNRKQIELTTLKKLINDKVSEK